MNNGNYSVMIAGIAKCGIEAYVKRYLKQLMEHSHQDKGCIFYNIHRSIDNPPELVVYMQWKNKKHINPYVLFPLDLVQSLIIEST